LAAPFEAGCQHTGKTAVVVLEMCKLFDWGESFTADRMPFPSSILGNKSKAMEKRQA
jgi:hypothetical protein